MKRICTAVEFDGVALDLQQLQSLGAGRRVLYIYAGPPRRFDARELGTVLGAEVWCVDILRDRSHDLSDHIVWQDIVASFESGFFSAAMMSPPCSTHSVARDRPLRGEVAPDIYGLPGLSQAEVEHTRLHTLLGLRAAELARLGNHHCIPWLAETPRMRRGHPSVFKLPEWLAVRQEPMVRHSDLDQCMFVDEPPRHQSYTYTKGTSIVGSCSLAGLSRTCSHGSKTWVLPSGTTRSSPHPPLRGRLPAHEIGTPPVQGDGNYLTLATAHYPAELTWQLLARLIAASANGSTYGLTTVPRPIVSTDSCRPARLDHAGRPVVQFTTPLKGPRPAPVGHQIGSLRNVTKSIDAVPGHTVVGQLIRQILELYFIEHPTLADKCCQSLGSDVPVRDLFPPKMSTSCGVTSLLCAPPTAIQCQLMGVAKPMASEAPCYTHGPLGQVIRPLPQRVG